MIWYHSRGKIPENYFKHRSSLAHYLHQQESKKINWSPPTCQRPNKLLTTELLLLQIFIHGGWTARSWRPDTCRLETILAQSLWRHCWRRTTTTPGVGPWSWRSLSRTRSGSYTAPLLNLIRLLQTTQHGFGQIISCVLGSSILFLKTSPRAFYFTIPLHRYGVNLQNVFSRWTSRSYFS